MKLSVIIPFLNEKDEVESTVKSVLEFSDNDVEIIIINDASDDDYDYEQILKLYDVRYIKNEKRLGVAESRNKGVKLSSAPYFILLDAHMRFYKKGWVDSIVTKLRNNPDYLLCCQTIELHKDNRGIVSRSETKVKTLGAVVNLYEAAHLFDPIWVKNSQEVGLVSDNLILIGCVLGAGYACSREYWFRLKGLDGLKYYGLDESLISMKVWLSGGKCVLLEDVAIGHIYREEFPYKTANKFFIYI